MSKSIDKFEVFVPIDGEDQVNWWCSAIQDYEVTGEYDMRLEYPNVKPYLHPSTGEVPWSAEILFKPYRVCLTHESNYHGSAAAAGILIMSFLRAFDLTDVKIVFPYARVPCDGEAGEYGGGVVEAKYCYVGETTTIDLIKDALGPKIVP